MRTKVPFSAFLLVASIFLWAQQSSSPIGVPRTIAESKSTMPISNLGGRICVLSEESGGSDVPLSEVEATKFWPVYDCCIAETIKGE